MNWKDIKVNEQDNSFEIDGQSLFNSFVEVMKFHAPGIAPVADKIGWFHINSDGQAIYESRYIRTFGFYCNRAAIWSKNGWFHINEFGIPVYSERYSWCGNFQSDICPVRDENNNYFHIHLDGKRLYTQNYSYAGDFKDGIGCVRKMNGNFIHINENGQPINECEFLDLGVFHKRFAIAKDKNGWHHIDNKGKAVYERRFSMIEPFYNGFSIVETFEGQKQVIDESGKTIVVL